MQPRIEVTRDERNEPVAETVAPIDWREVLRRSEELRSSGRDLRLLVIVARALANEEGLAGLGDGLTLIARTVELHWDTLHPEMRDTANALDAARPRINAVMQLKNPRGLLGDLRRHVFFTVRGLGPVTGKDLERGNLDVRTVVAESGQGLNAREQAEAAAAQEALIARVRKACAAQAEQGPGELTALAEGARAAVAGLDALEKALSEKIGSTLTLAHTSEESIAASLRHFLTRVLATAERPVQPGAQGTDAAPSADGGGTPAPAATAGGGVGLPDRIASRGEVTKCLDLIIAFYERTEPASPIPHLARRMRRMVPMDFIELMEDLAPSGLKEFRLLAGVSDNRKPAAKDER